MLGYRTLSRAPHGIWIAGLDELCHVNPVCMCANVILCLSRLDETTGCGPPFTSRLTRLGLLTDSKHLSQAYQNQLTDHQAWHSNPFHLLSAATLTTTPTCITLSTLPPCPRRSKPPRRRPRCTSSSSSACSSSSRATSCRTSSLSQTGSCQCTARILVHSLSKRIRDFACLSKVMRALILSMTFSQAAPMILQWGFLIIILALCKYANS